MGPGIQLPLVVFSHGNGGGSYECYDGLLSAVAARGFIVASIESVGTASSEFRGEQILCASRWLTHTWTEKARLRGDLAFMGHSAAAEGSLYAIGLRQQLIDIQGQNSLDTLNLRSVVSLTPPSNIQPQPLGDSVARPPILFLHGGTDNNPTHQSIPLYDSLAVSEDDPTNEAGRSLVWVYDLAHFSIGGQKAGTFCSSGTPKGIAVASAYASRFLRWRMNGEVALRTFFAGHPLGGTEMEALPPEVMDSSFWQDKPEWNGSPRIFRQHTSDQNLLFEERHVLDAFEDGNPFTSTAQGTVEVSGAIMLTEGVSNLILPQVNHRTGALRVDVTGPGAIRWNMTAELQEMLIGASFLSFRVGNWLQIDPVSCVSNDAPIPLSVGFKSGLDFMESDAGEIPVQDHRIIASFAGTGPLVCAWTTYMKTVRIPLAPLCAAGFNLTELEFVSFSFPAINDTMLIDSLEFTRSPYDEPGNCGPPLECEP